MDPQKTHYKISFSTKASKIQNSRFFLLFPPLTPCNSISNFAQNQRVEYFNSTDLLCCACNLSLLVFRLELWVGAYRAHWPPSLGESMLVWASLPYLNSFVSLSSPRGRSTCAIGFPRLGLEIVPPGSHKRHFGVAVAGVWTSSSCWYRHFGSLLAKSACIALHTVLLLLAIVEAFVCLWDLPPHSDDVIMILAWM